MKQHFQEKAEIIRNVNIAPLRYRLIFKANKIAKSVKPGQFVHVRVSESAQVLLRRPFSVHRVSRAGAVEIIYEVVGRGTSLLSEKRPGIKLDIIGPLGNGFDLGSTSEVGFSHASRTPPRWNLLIAGGMGVAPLMFLAEKMKGKKTLVLIGAKTKSHLVCVNDFKKLGCKVKVATDDGSMGFKGKVTGLLKETLRLAISDMPYGIYACGPLPMLKIIGTISKKNNLPSQVSMEQFMGCGLGACMGCVIKTRYGYKRVCHDGPVFDAEDII